MSSILEALRKVEKESPPAAELPPGPYKIDPRSVVPSRTRRYKFYRRLGPFLGGGFILISLGWLAIHHSSLINTILFADRSETELTAPRPTQPKPIVAKHVPSSVVPLQSKDRTYKPDSLPKPASHPSDLAADPLKPDRRPADNAAAIAAFGRPPSSKQKALLTRSGIKKPAGEKYKLQALAWSPDVQQRMAVINGCIVKEGASLDGFKVLHIREDAVILHNGVSTWRIEFQLKSRF